MDCADFMRKKSFCEKKEFMDGYTEKGTEYRFDHVVRHELIHAFAEESGVSYGNDENLVDWIANMIPKINKCYEEIMRRKEENN